MIRKYWNVRRVCAWGMFWIGVAYMWVDQYDRASACMAFGCFFLLAARDDEARDATR